MPVNTLAHRVSTSLGNMPQRVTAYTLHANMPAAWHNTWQQSPQSNKQQRTSQLLEYLAPWVHSPAAAVAAAAAADAAAGNALASMVRWLREAATDLAGPAEQQAAATARHKALAHRYRYDLGHLSDLLQRHSLLLWVEVRCAMLC
jgi:hypothetical protein